MRHVGLLVGLALSLATAGLLAAAPSSHAAFPGGVGRIAFDGMRGGFNMEIYAVNGDGSGLMNLTQDPAADANPAWSPDGTKIAFSSDRDGGGMYVMNSDGSSPTRLTDSTPYDCCAAWSPDGGKIAFDSYRDDPNPTQCGSRLSGPCSYDIYTMNATGGGVTRLTTDPGMDVNPAWSPDGTKIAYHAGRADDTCDVFVMDADGSNPVNLTAGLGLCSDSPAWSPDGAKIAFALYHSSSDDIYVMDADGSNPTPVTTDPIEYERMPAWSPDGAKIVFKTLFGSVWGLAVINADGSGQTQLTTENFDSSPDWQPLHDGTVGGVARLPDLPAGGSSGDSVSTLVAGAAAVALGGVLVGGAAWRTRRRERR